MASPLEALVGRHHLGHFTGRTLRVQFPLNVTSSGNKMV
jgi:hypothetical protein